MKSPFGAAVYVSYAWADEDSAKAVDELTKRFEKTFITFKPDKFTLQPNDSFKEFIEEIGKANCIIILYSEAYFNSFYCMLELAKIIEHSKTSCSNQAFDCHVRNRVIGINLKGLNGSYITDIDIQQSIQCTTLEKEFDSKTCGETYIGLKAPYKSEDEQELIKDRFDDFNAIFAHRLNHRCIDEACFVEVIDKARLNAKRYLKENPFFIKACETFLPVSSYISPHIKKAFKSPDLETRSQDSLENQLTTLMTLPQDELVKILQAVCASGCCIDNFLMHLFPFYVQLEQVKSFQEQLEKTTGIIKAKYVLPPLIELLMAAVDKRAAGLQAILISEQSDSKELAVISKYRVYQAPEVGDQASIQPTVMQDIANQLGLDSYQSEVAIDKTRDYFLSHHVPQNKYIKKLSIAVQQQRIRQVLEKEGAATWYFIVPYEAENHHFWEKYAEEIQDISRKLVVIRQADPLSVNLLAEIDSVEVITPLFRT